MKAEAEAVPPPDTFMGYNDLVGDSTERYLNMAEHAALTEVYRGENPTVE